MSKLDSLIGKIAPRWGFERAIYRHNTKVLNTIQTSQSDSGGYRDGYYGRSRSAPGRSTMSEDTAAGWTHRTMIANAMQLYRDDPMTKSIVDVSSTYLGESRPTATTDDDAFNAEATQWFNEVWWPQADARGRSGVDFGEFQTLFDKWQWLGGDMLYMLYKGQLLPYEGTQIQTPYGISAEPNIVNGIRVQKVAPWRVTHYYICNGNQGAQTDFKRVRASEAIYAGSRNWRTAMLRSVPDLHSVIDAMYGYNRTNDNVQKRIEFESMMFSVERNGAVGNMPQTRMISADNAKGTQVEQTKAEWGMRLKVNGDPDKDFKFLQMQNPNSNYTQVQEHMARSIASGTGFPYEIVMHIYTSGSFTAHRAARLDFAKALMGRWAWRNKVFNQRVYNWRTAKAIKEGELRPAPVDPITGLSQWHKCSWSLPHFPHIDEGKEVVADIKQWGCGQESIGDWAQQKGQTRAQMLDAHDTDIKEMQARAKVLGIPLEQYAGQLFTASAAPEESEDPDAEKNAPSEKKGIERWLT